MSASVCRSSRRSGGGCALGGGSGGGGPSSSGYESMHTGASELSLSHQDSASDCSGHVKEILTRRPSLDKYRRRCNSQHHRHHHHHHHHHSKNVYQHQYLDEHQLQHLNTTSRILQSNNIKSKQDVTFFPL